MTPKSPKVSFLTNKLIARGIRLTSQRRLILELIESSGGHLDAAQIQDMARERDSKVDRATVYRTLSLLKKQGLIEELDFLHVRGGQHFYEAKGRGEHVHVCCYTCGMIRELNSGFVDSIKNEAQESLGFTPDSIRIEIGGYCEKCGHSEEDQTG